MDIGSGQRLAWTVRRPGASDRDDHETLDRLLKRILDACNRAFPEAQGYRHRIVALQGVIDGFEVRITRAAFRAVISTQRYRSRVSGDLAPRPEIRLVAVAGAAPTGGSASGVAVSGRRLRPRLRWSGLILGAGLLGWALGAGALIVVLGAAAASRPVVRRVRARRPPPPSLRAASLHFEDTLPMDLDRFANLSRALEQLAEVASRGLDTRPFRRALAAGAEDWAGSA